MRTQCQSREAAADVRLQEPHPIVVHGAATLLISLSENPVSEFSSRTLRKHLEATSAFVTDSEHTQQRVPQVLKPEKEYATFAYVEHAERPAIFLIQQSPPRPWSYRKQGLHGPEMGARRVGKRA